MDPYFEFKLEIENSIQILIELNSNYLNLLKSSSSSSTTSSNPDKLEELNYSLSELKVNLNSIELDLNELEEIVKMVELNGIQMGLNQNQIKERRIFVNRVKKEINSIRKSIGPTKDSTVEARNRLSANLGKYKPSTSTTSGSTGGIRSNDYNSDEEDDDEEEDVEEEFELHHQSILIEQQDRTLTDISGTVNLLREQAKVMGREVFDQNAMLEDLDSHLDQTSSKLTKAQRRMGNFVKENQSSPASWCILILIVILTLLLIFILFF